MEKGGFVYIMTNKPHGVLYTGVTANLPHRIYLHRTGQGSDFCRKWGLIRLVLIEPFPTIAEAIVREKRVKSWKRDWRVRLIEEANPAWDDLFDTLNA